MLLLLTTAHLHAKLDATGRLLCLVDLHHGLCHALASDVLRLRTDRGDFSSAETTAVVVEKSGSSVCLAWADHPLGRIEMAIELAAGLPLLRRRVRLVPREPLALLEITWETRFATVPVEVLPYDTFWNAPTVAFVRWPGASVLAGIEIRSSARTICPKACARASRPACCWLRVKVMRARRSSSAVARPPTDA